MTVGSYPKKLQANLAETLKAVWRTSRLECSAADDRSACTRDDSGAVLNLFLAFHAAGSCHRNDRWTADRHPANLDY
jgi:hypothetical protein